MPSLPTLLKKLELVTREIAEREGIAADLRRQVIEIANAPRKRKPSSANALDAPGVAEAVKLLRERGPMLCREVAGRLGITGMAAGWRLRQALKLGLVERVSHGKYQCSATAQAA